MSAVNQNDALQSRAKFFTGLASHLFLSTAREIRDISLKKTSAEGLSEEAGVAISIGAIITGAAIGAGAGATLSGVGIMAGAKHGSQAGGYLGKLSEKCISEILKFNQRDQYKKLHKGYLDGFDPDNLKDSELKLVVEFFYDVYKNYNVQFWGMLGSSDALEDSSENAMTKMAIDIVHRIFEYMKEEVKDKVDYQGSGSFTREDLISGLMTGQSGIPGTIKDKFLRNHKGRTIKLQDGKELNSQSLLEDPFRIQNDLDIDSYKKRTTSDRKCYYRYEFSLNVNDNKQSELAKQLRSEAGIYDMYCELENNKACLLEEIAKELKPFRQQASELFLLTLQAIEEAEISINQHTTNEVSKAVTEIKSQQKVESHLLEEIAKELKPLRQQASENFSQTLQAIEEAEISMNKHTINEVSKAVTEIKTQQKEETHSVVLLGDTGVGKSTVARYLAGTFDKVKAQNRFKVSHDKTVVTNVVDRSTEFVFGRRLQRFEHVKLHIGDTPGLGGTAENEKGEKISDDEVIELIKQHIRIHCKAETDGVSAFLLVLNNKAGINEKSLKLYIDAFKAEDLVSNLIVVINRSKLKKIKENTMLDSFKEKFLKIIGDGRDLQKGTKDLVEEIKAVYFNFGITDKTLDPCLPKNPETQEILKEQLIKLVQLTQELGKHKIRY